MHRDLIRRIFSISNEDQFNQLVLEIFQYQYQNNTVYRTFCEHLGIMNPSSKGFHEIPFLPIEFFKSKKLVTSAKKPELIFESSGTTGQQVSKHHVLHASVYEQSFTKGFEMFYGPIEEYCVLALLPAYLERQHSSLVYMVNEFIKCSKYPESGFYLYDLEGLSQKLEMLERKGIKTLLIGVSFALLDLAEQFPMPLENTIIMETGGMKGRRKELIREELHSILKMAFQVSKIHSEYGMTELLSQAYSLENGFFKSPPWMRVFTRDPEDPLSLQHFGKTGGINIIDLANIHSCSFIATQDLGKTFEDGSFEVLGRFDHSDIRGCNLMAL